VARFGEMAELCVRDSGSERIRNRTPQGTPQTGPTGPNLPDLSLHHWFFNNLRISELPLECFVDRLIEVEQG
jgi:hypothetical protein